MSGEKPNYPSAPPMQPGVYQPQQVPMGYGAPNQYAQPGYPYQQQQMYGQPSTTQGMVYTHPAGQAPQAGYAPPPYSAQPQGAPPPYSQYPNQAMAQPAQPAQPPMPQPQQVFVPGAFDAGARFDGVAQPRIPPPPPGCAPNMAQMAQLQGHNVSTTQQKSDWLSGGKGGGYTFW